MELLNESSVDKDVVVNDSKEFKNCECKEIIEIIEHLINQPEINFKSQQIGDTELTNDEKKEIAYNVYIKNIFTFVIKFGSYLNDNQLDFLKNSNENDCEIDIITSQLKKHLNNKKILTKNRRYEAMSKMLKTGTYFSEHEMMKRNPLLYEQLVGKYLSQEEKLARDNIDTKNLTLLNVLMEGVDKQITNDYLEKQKCQEECQMEESEEEDEDLEEENNHIRTTQWGEFSNTKPTSFSKDNIENTLHITSTERCLLKEEFNQEMYRSFLAGEDKEFDYNTIDNNSDYDSVDLLARDEEDKYFDSETPEEKMELSQEEKEESEGEDELDVFMKHLSHHHSLQQT